MDSTRALALTLHILGIALWCSGLLGIAAALLFRKGEKDPAVRLRFGAFARRVGRLADGGATLTLLGGLGLLAGAPEAYLRQPWMHMKLTLVVLGAFGAHGFFRVKAKRAATAEGGTFPMAAALGVVAVFGTIIALVVWKPLAR